MLGNDFDLHEQARHYIAMEEAELYASLVPEADRDAAAFAPGGLVARGKELFGSIWRDISGAVCGYYRQHEKTVSTQVDLAVLLATPLLGNPVVAGVSAMALAALIVKIGVGELCARARNA